MANPFQDEFDSTRAAKMRRMGASDTTPQRVKGEQESGCTVSEHKIPAPADETRNQFKEDR